MDIIFGTPLLKIFKIKDRLLRVQETGKVIIRGTTLIDVFFAHPSYSHNACSAEKATKFHPFIDKMRFNQICLRGFHHPPLAVKDSIFSTLFIMDCITIQL